MLTWRPVHSAVPDLRPRRAPSRRSLMPPRSVRLTLPTLLIVSMLIAGSAAAAAPATNANPPGAPAASVKPSTGAKLPPLAIEPRLFKELAARPIGPANMGGRVSDFAVVEKRPATIYVAL